MTAKQDRLESLFRGVMGETVHTAFRKGSEHPSSLKTWKAIHAMPPNAWSECVEWMCWALAYSLKSELQLTKRGERVAEQAVSDGN